MKLLALIWRLLSSLFKKSAPVPEVRSEAQEAFDLYKSRGIIIDGPGRYKERIVIRRHPVRLLRHDLEAGTQVSWISKSRGKETKLTGEVVLVLPAGERKEDGLARLPDHDHSRAGHGDPRDHVSYFVEVFLHDRSRPFIYHPRVSSLFLVV